jgi:putative transcriptional regulator
MMTAKENISAEAAEILEAIRQIKAGEVGRVYTPEQILAIAARRSSKLTQMEFAELLDVSVDAIRDWEQGRRSPRGAARTLLRVAMQHPDVLRQLDPHT